MKRILFLAGIVVVGTALVCGVVFAWQVLVPQFFSPDPSPAGIAHLPSPAVHPLPDADALAARLPHDQDVYRKVRDEALAAYAKLHPTPAPVDDEAHATLKLIAYLSVWDDYYGEGLRQMLNGHLDRMGNSDPTWPVFCIVDNFMHHHSNNEAYATQVAHEMIAYDSTPYPALFRLCALRASLKDLIYPQIDPDIHLGHAPDALPELANRAVADYRALLDNNFRHYFFYAQADILFDTAQADEATITAISTGLDHALAANQPGSSLDQVVDADFFTNYAWTARGSDVASTVTSSGWQLMAQRLQRAEQILVPLYDKAPQEADMVSRAMMPVVLGEQQPRDQMELWFQRGIQADPDNFGIYMAKRWYLLPRWYGSDEEVWAFGLECAKSDNWSAKIPMILIEAISDAGDRDPSVYADLKSGRRWKKFIAIISSAIPTALITGASSRATPPRVATGMWRRSSLRSSATTGTATSSTVTTNTRTWPPKPGPISPATRPSPPYFTPPTRPGGQQRKTARPTIFPAGTGPKKRLS
jgi:uncharacterized membrane protein